MRCARAVANVEFGAGNPVYPLLFDPQVSECVLSETVVLVSMMGNLVDSQMYNASIYDITPVSVVHICCVQTSGGLLAAVPLDRAEEAVAALKAAGYPETAVVGKVVARPEKGEFAPLVYLLNKE